MRKIKPGQILLFFIMLMIAVSLGVLTNSLIVGWVWLGDFRGVVLTLAGIIFIYGYAILLYRGFLWVMPLPVGEIAEDSREEFGYHVYLLFFLMLFYPIMRSGFIPVPLMRVVYLMLGARMGENTYSGGIILDPSFVSIGRNTLIGQGSLFVPHVIEGQRLAHYPITIGDHVTIGAHAVVLSGVTIGDHAMVATGAVVPKGSQIGPGEVWGGVPARLLRSGTLE